MTVSIGQSGDRETFRIAGRAGSAEGSCLPRDVDALQEAFVRAHALERREPGGGKWPFAGDGPWHLIQPEVGDIAGDFSETLIHTDAGKELRVRKVESREPRTPL